MTDPRDLSFMDPLRDAELFQIKSPGDGVYRVRLVGDDVANVANVSFAGAGDTQQVRLRPGAYTAWIEPLGAAAGFQQAVELAPDRTIELRDEVAFTPTGLRRSAPARPSWGATLGQKPAATADHQVRAFAMGVSVDAALGVLGGWQGDVPGTCQTFADQRGIAVVFQRPETWRERPRWRLTLALEGERLWRIPLPLFRGGLQVAFSPVFTPTGPDLALSLAPRDPVTAALVASLNQLFGGSATEVVEATLAREDSSEPPVADAIDTLSDRLDDPWAATAAALLMARCGEMDVVESGVRRLGASYPWLPDAAVVVAWADASAEGPRGDLEIRCFEGIQEARRRGAPYFIATDALVRDMLTALAMSAESHDLRAEANEELGIWTSRSRLRMRSGPFLSWEESSLEPGASISLAPPDYAPIALGQIVADPSGLMLKSERIASSPALESAPVMAAAPAAPAPTATRAPALDRPIRHGDDPNKGRFGGQASGSGFRLGATFGRGGGGWVRITLTVHAPSPDYRASVELFLHDTFEPDRFEVAFENGVAELVTLAYGGFTVGAWIADAGIELELDLAEMPDAPPLIVEN